jgi:peroxiredoxin Q/BCP
MTDLKEGRKAPSFTAYNQNGIKVSLKDFLGKRVVLYFYPHDDTPTCTVQACNLKDNYADLTKHGYVVIGVSTDSMKSHKKFAQKYELPFTLIADEEHKIVEKYGVWGEKKFLGRTFIGTHRTTFLIDEGGRIRRIITKPKSKIHTQQVLEAWEDGK